VGRSIGYMLTWTCYGTWLQGDERGWSKDGRHLKGNAALREANLEQMSEQVSRLGAEDKDAVRESLTSKAAELGQEVVALSVFSNHVHILLRCIDRPVARVAQMYKRAGTTALRKIGVAGKVWGRGYSVRYCFNEKGLTHLAAYVRGHGEG
jgi:REP element-mobilizing transposase RayT